MNAAPDYVRDTIVAPATPPGKGAIGIVRMSGPAAAAIGERMLGTLPAPREAAFLTFHDAAGRPLDRGIALWFPAPGSYTGEPVLELQGHGGPAVLSLIVAAAVELGARRAEPGEFSRRAFLNGKLDLAQAEAIADLIDAGSAQAARAAERSLSGEFSRRIADLVELLTGLRLHVEAAIDFPDEEIDFLADAALAARIDATAQAFDALTAAAENGRLLRDGYRVVILGPPNAGKSSLLNRLSGEESAIVTEVAGTTRDILREQIAIDGLLVELVDTAGLRDDPDRVEAEGIRRAERALTDADAVLWVTDDTADDDGPPPGRVPAGLPLVMVRNKADLSGAPTGTSGATGHRVTISALTGAGIDALRTTIRELAGGLDVGEGAFTARQRHVEALLAAERHFRRGAAALSADGAGEILAEELKLAQDALAAVGGALASDELLGRIFGAFCIGK